MLFPLHYNNNMPSRYVAEKDFRYILSDASSEDYVTGEITPTPYEIHNISSSYWEMSELRDKVAVDLDKSLFLHLNVQCLPAKFDSLITFFNAVSSGVYRNLPSVFALSETWLNDFNESSYVFPGYHPLIAKSRPDNSSRGGVALLIRDDLHYIDRPDLNVFIPTIFESLFITLQQHNLTIGVIYKTPDSDAAQFLSQYERTLNQLIENKDRYTLLGDFNIDLLKFNSSGIVADFVDATFSRACIPLITIPTRVDVISGSASCLDNIITNTIEPPLETGVVIEDISDHYLVFYSVPNKLTSKQRVCQKATFRNFSKNNISKLLSSC